MNMREMISNLKDVRERLNVVKESSYAFVELSYDISELLDELKPMPYIGCRYGLCEARAYAVYEEWQKFLHGENDLHENFLPEFDEALKIMEQVYHKAVTEKAFKLAVAELGVFLDNNETSSTEELLNNDKFKELLETFRNSFSELSEQSKKLVVSIS